MHLSPSPHLDVQDGATTVVRLLDSHLVGPCVHEIGETLFRLAEEDGASAVCLDLGPVKVLSSACLGKFVALHRRLRAAGRQLRLLNVQPFVYEVLERTRLSKLFTVERAAAPGDEANVHFIHN